jgi:hypothetical protein
VQAPGRHVDGPGGRPGRRQALAHSSGQVGGIAVGTGCRAGSRTAVDDGPDCWLLAQRAAEARYQPCL